ncbi:type II toxin-antitoxin system HigB family toxin [Plectonema radiosum]|nr:type II toxin-antitoxin system HigB family toxin [Plectonema radiosum]
MYYPAKNQENLIEVQTAFPQAEAVGNFTVFNIKGNKYIGLIFAF